jgi:hypothetical protein
MISALNSKPLPDRPAAKSTDLPIEVGKREDVHELHPLRTWQLASGMAHGKQWASLALNELKEEKRTPDELSGLWGKRRRGITGPRPVLVKA